MKFLTSEDLARLACLTVATFAPPGQDERFTNARAEQTLARVNRASVRAEDGEELQFALVELIRAIADEGPLESLNLPLAFVAAVSLAAMNGYTLRIPVYLEDEPDRCEEYLAELPEWLTPRGPAAQLSLLETTTQSLNLSLDGVRAYVVSSLTGLDAAAHEWTVGRSGEIASALSEFGIEVHQPCLHTDPETDPDIPPAHVHRTDYEKVITSDLIVAIGDRPSWGGGKELGWADANMAPVLITVDVETRVSRLVMGSPGLVTEKVISASGSLSAAIREFVVEHADLLRAHAELRRERKKAFAPALDLLRQSLGRVNHPGSLLTEERAREIVLSVDHFAMTSVEQILWVARKCGLPPAELFGAFCERKQMVAPAVRDSAAFDRRELLALENAAELANWSRDQALRRLQRAFQLKSRSGTYRHSFREIEDWLALDDD